MSSIGGEAPQRATAAQMANRAIKSARGRRNRVTPSSSTPSQSMKPFGNIDPNAVPTGTSQPQQSFMSNGFAFGQSQSFPPANPASTQPSQNGTSLSFGGASNPSSFNFSNSFSSGQAPSNPFSNANPSQGTSAAGFQGFQGSIFNLSGETKNDQTASDKASHNASAAGFNNMSSTSGANPLFSVNQPTTSSSGNILGQSTTESAAPSGGLFGQNGSKPGPFGQQQPFATPSTPSSSAQTSGLFGGSGDAMQTTPDGKPSASAPKTALFGMSSQPSAPFGSTTSTAGGASVFSNPAPQSTPFAGVGSGSSSGLFQPKPTEASASGGSSLFGRISKPPEPATEAPDSSTQNGPGLGAAADSNPPKTTGANVFSPSLKPTQGATTGNYSPKFIGANMFAPLFKPSGFSQSPTSPLVGATGPNPSFPTPQPFGQTNQAPFNGNSSPNVTGGNIFSQKPKTSWSSTAQLKNESQIRATDANMFSPNFQSSGPTPPTVESTSANNTGSNLFLNASQSSAQTPAPATDSAPSTTTGNLFASAFKPPAPASTQSSTGSLFANAKPPTATNSLFSSVTPSAPGTSTPVNAPSLFANPPATSGAQTPATASSSSLFAVSNASSTAPAPAASAPAPTTLFGAPASTASGSTLKPSPLGPAMSSTNQSTTGPSNMFSSTANDINKKTSEASDATSTSQPQPLGNQSSSSNLFSAKPTFGVSTGTNLFAPKPATQPPSAPDTSESKIETTPQSVTPGLFGQAPTAATTAAPGEAAKPASFGETPKTTSSSATSSASNLFDTSISAPSAASAFGKPKLFGESQKTVTPTCSSSVNPPLFGAKPTSSSNAAATAVQTTEQGRSAPVASGTQQAKSASADAGQKEDVRTKGMRAKPDMTVYAPSSIPEHLTQNQKEQFDKLYRVKMLNDSFKKKIAEMDPKVEDFVSVIKYYVRVRDALGAPTGLVNKNDLKRNSKDITDNTDDDSERRTKEFRPSENQTDKKATDNYKISQQSDFEMAGSSQAAKQVSVEPPRHEESRTTSTKRKAEDDGEGRPSSTPTQTGKRARNVEEPLSKTMSLFASSFASSTGAGNNLTSDETNDKSEKDEQRGENSRDANETAEGSSEEAQSNGDAAPSASANGRSLFDRIQYDETGQAKRAPAVEESTDKDGSNGLSSLLSGSKFASSFNTPGASSPQPFKTNFDFGKAVASSSSGRSTPLNGDKPANQETDSAKSTPVSSGSPAPPTFGSSSVLGTQSGPAGDNTWKNDSPIRFAVSKPAESSSAGATSASGAATPTASSSQFPSLFGAKAPQPSLGPGSVGSNTPQAGFGFGVNSPANPAVQSVGLSATTSADPSRSTTPGITSDATGAEESGDGEGEKLAQVDLTRSGAGEEDEEVLLELRASAFRLSKESGWEKRGTGPLRVLKHRENGRSRVLLRADPSGNVVLNVALQENHPYTQCKNSVQLLVPETDGKLVQWALRVKTADNANKLAGTMVENRK